MFDQGCGFDRWNFFVESQNQLYGGFNAILSAVGIIFSSHSALSFDSW